MTITAPTPARAAVLLISVVAATILLLVFAVASRADTGERGTQVETPPTEVVVVSGDSLWAIAERHASPGDNIAELAFDIRVANDLDSSVINPGQVLVVPSG